jgi:hypothetical protein
MKGASGSDVFETEKEGNAKNFIYKSRSRTVMIRFKFQDRKARNKNQPFKETVVVLMVNFFLEKFGIK